MKVRIHNDGKSAYLTQVTNVETGEVIDHVTQIEFSLSARDRSFPLARLTIASPMVDIIADAVIRECCPHCGRQSEEG